MERDILDEVQRLRAERRPFALATVVAAKQPASGTPGARAIILADGQLEGWIGGSCARPTVVRQGLEAIADGASRLVVLRPDAPPEDGETLGVVNVPMLCASQGELQIFVEPFLPRIELAIIGASPAARALARLGTLLEFDVWACDPDADMDSFPEANRLVPSLDALTPQLGAHCYVVVATMNAYDEDALEATLASDASYVGVVASQKRLAALQRTLRQRGVSEERLQRLQRPKGLTGIALRPSEIAFSAMAALLEARSQRIGLDMENVEHMESEQSQTTPATPRAEAIDPICGMTVDIATARYTSDRDGQTYYFCCAGCKARFDAS